MSRYERADFDVSEASKDPLDSMWCARVNEEGRMIGGFEVVEPDNENSYVFSSEVMEVKP